MRLLLVVIAGMLMGAGCPPTPTPHDMGPPADMAVMLDLAVPAGVLACPVAMPLPTASDVCDGLFTNTDGTFYACVRCEAGGCMDTVDKMYCVVSSCSSDKRCGQPPRAQPKPKLKRGK
jgi:hypothetical protein